MVVGVAANMAVLVADFGGATDVASARSVSSTLRPRTLADTRWVVFRIGTTISALDILTHRVVRLPRVAPHTLSISVSRGRVAWAENTHGHGHIRTVQLPSRFRLSAGK
jgi:hypothetical protein